MSLNMPLLYFASLFLFVFKEKISKWKVKSSYESDSRHMQKKRGRDYSHDTLKISIVNCETRFP